MREQSPARDSRIGDSSIRGATIMTRCGAFGGLAVGLMALTTAGQATPANVATAHTPVFLPEVESLDDLPGAMLDAADFTDHFIHHFCHRAVHCRWIIALQKAWSVTITHEEVV